MGSSPSYNYPAQPTYGEGMREALEAQVALLTGGQIGDADFRAVGPLKGLIEQYEAPIRMTTAQTDTDVLRQTLLGRGTGETFANDGRIIEGYRDNPDAEGGYKVEKSHKLIQSPITLGGSLGGSKLSRDAKYEISHRLIDNDGKIIKESTIDVTVPKNQLDTISSEGTGILSSIESLDEPAAIRRAYELAKPKVKEDLSEFITSDQVDVIYNADRLDAVSLTAGGGVEERVPVFKKNPDGTDYVAPPGSFTPGQSTRTGDGMIDLLGDSRKALDPTTGSESDRQAGFDAEGNFLGLAALAEDIQRGNLSRQREADLADVERLSDRYQTVMEDYAPATTTGIRGARDLIEEQKEALTKGTNAVTIPGDSTYGGDMTAGTMTAAQVGDAPDLTAGTSYDPSASVTGGTFDAGTSYTAAQVADPMALTAATSYDPSASVTGDGYTATANLEGGNIGADSLRAALLADAETALSQGLTEREQAKISNAARARSTMMGRTFDQSGAIAEAQALVGEDNNRRMQNRGFAGQTLGREADIQRSDLDRGLQANIRNQDALNRAAEFGASQNMQAQLANQAATNQALSQGLTAGLSQEALAAQQAQAKAMADATAANRASEFGVSAGLEQEAQANQAALQAQLANQAATNQAAQFGVGAGMEQDALRAQLGQQNNMAQAQFDQQAAAFDADAAQRASQVNQAQTQQANQFGVGATMDAERLNEQLRQQGLGNYINAVGNLAQIEDTYTLDPFQALLGRGGGGSLASGQSVFGQAGYGLNSGPQYLNPEAGLGYISNMAANQASMYGAQLAADATRDAGMMSMIGGIGGGIAGGLIGLAG